MPLDHRAHRAVHDEDSLTHERGQLLAAIPACVAAGVVVGRGRVGCLGAAAHVTSLRGRVDVASCYRAASPRLGACTPLAAYWNVRPSPHRRRAPDPLSRPAEGDTLCVVTSTSPRRPHRPSSSPSRAGTTSPAPRSTRWITSSRPPARACGPTSTRRTTTTSRSTNRASTSSTASAASSGARRRSSTRDSKPWATCSSSRASSRRSGGRRFSPNCSTPARVVVCGALGGDTPHTRPLPVTLTSPQPATREAYDAKTPTYVGPAGIVGILIDALGRSEVTTIAQWVVMPQYALGSPQPKVTWTMVQGLSRLLDVALPEGDLEEQARAWERGVSELVAQDGDMTSYVDTLEHSMDVTELPEASGDAIAEQFEQFLRRRDGDSRRGEQGPGGDTV
ncbi:MAG: hypothetical protein DI618_12205 [Dermacoccus nishinomiyaensis]|nr:MAG: hypothetical protein DI618_12205 [Dermacoccus nishinomiyaensis]